LLSEKEKGEQDPPPDLTAASSFTQKVEGTKILETVDHIKRWRAYIRSSDPNMIHYWNLALPHHLFAVILVANVVAVLAPKQLQAELILPTSPLHFATLVGNPIAAVCTAAVKVAQKGIAKAGELRSWLRQLSELQRSFGVGVGDGEVEVEDLGELVLRREVLEELLDGVEDWEEDDEDLVLDVEVRDDEEEERGVCETQRTCPIERSQFASREGFQAYNWADVIPKLVSIK
jgi:hypothetical protein